MLVLKILLYKCNYFISFLPFYQVLLVTFTIIGLFFDILSTYFGPWADLRTQHHYHLIKVNSPTTQPHNSNFTKKGKLAFESV